MYRCTLEAAADKPAQRRQLNSKQCTAASCSRGGVRRGRHIDVTRRNIGLEPSDAAASHVDLAAIFSPTHATCRSASPTARRTSTASLLPQPGRCCTCPRSQRPQRRVAADRGTRATVPTAFRSTVILVQMEHKDWVSPIFWTACAQRILKCQLPLRLIPPGPAKMSEFFSRCPASDTRSSTEITVPIGHPVPRADAERMPNATAQRKLSEIERAREGGDPRLGSPR